MKTLDELAFETGIMPIIFADDPDGVARAVTAIEQTAMPVMEILQRGDKAEESLKRALSVKKNSYIGAGTICTLEPCKRVVDLGADFIVSPGYNPEMVDWCVKNNVTIIPGVSNPSEVMMAADAGLKTLKFFPFNELGGEKYMDGIAGPFPDVKFVITGFLDERDLHYLSNHRVSAIGGVWMFCGETDTSIISSEEIISRMAMSANIANLYRHGWK